MSSPLIPIPTMSLNGWVKSGSAKADYAIAYFFESNYSQTNLYRGQVSSLSYLVFRYGQDPNTMVSQLERTLTAYLQRYYPDGVYVSATHDANSSTNQTSRYSITLVMEISEGGQVKSMGKLINFAGGKTISIIDTNNGTTSNTGTAS